MGGKPRAAARVSGGNKAELSHFDESGKAHMVGVSEKPETERVATASGRVLMHPDTAQKIAEGTAAKGDVLGVARVAAIQAIKRTSELIPLCHPLRITGVSVDFEIRTQAQARVSIVARVEAMDRTGVEMEALTAVSVAALTIYDMCKAIDRRMKIDDVRLDAKSGGRSGDWWRDLG